MDHQEHMEEAQEEQQWGALPPALVVETMSRLEKAKYFGSAALTTTILADLVGMGATSLVIGLAAGGVAAYWSEEIRGVIMDHLPAPKQATTRQSKLQWLLTGQVATPHVPDDEKKAEQEQQRDEPQTAGMQGVIDLAPNLQIPVNDIAGKAIFIVGMRRSGKTTLGARLAEEFGRHFLPLLIPCLEGDYLSLVEVLPRAIIVGHPGAEQRHCRYDFTAIIPEKDDKGYKLNEAVKFGYELLEVGYQAILDLSSYPSLDEAIMIQVGIIRGMFLWADTHPENRCPSYVYLDEAQRYLPENLKESVVDHPAILDQLFKAYKDIIAIGGKRGISPVILTQRFAQVNKKIMAQSEVLFIMKQTFDIDLKRCMEFVKKSTAIEEQIAEFKQGQGVYIAADGSQLLTRFHQRRSSGERSHTPKAEMARRYAMSPREVGQKMPFTIPGPACAPSVPPSDLRIASPSPSPSSNRASLRLVEGGNEAMRRGNEGAEGGEGEEEILSELEKRIGEMFFVQGMNPNAIAKELWPKVIGGDAYQKNAGIVADAIRKVAQRKRV